MLLHPIINWRNPYRQQGTTLIECLIAVAIGGLILSATNHLLHIALKGYEVGVDKAAHDRVQQVTNRLVWAMDTSMRLKKSELPFQNDPTKSGVWFDRIDPVTGKKISIEYKWDLSSRVLREKNAETGIDSGMLANVSDFSVTAPDNTEMAVVTVSLTVGDPPNQITVVEKRRLGGPW